jgi:nitrogen-specific signal transduction histidine kinase
MIWKLHIGIPAKLGSARLAHSWRHPVTAEDPMMVGAATVFVVTDIPEDKLKEVFEPFFTSKAEGMGMGLSIARTIIEAHHGLIYAKNRDHGGASFRIRFPLVR